MGMDDDLEGALALGQRNQELIALGKAWCTHIRTDRSGMGIGMLEEMTGLPITGGRFTCDYARRPVEWTGMQLEDSAVEFYENNCRDCPDRRSGDRIPNLGTWAEGELSARAQLAAQNAETERAAERDRAQRVQNRLLVGASLDAASQEVVSHINALDADPADERAAESLRTAARLTPDAFSNAIREILYVDARQLKLAVVLEVLISLEKEDAPQSLHSLSVDAVRDGWARADGCRYLSEHGVVEDISDALLEAVIFHAAPTTVLPPYRSGEPAALLRYHSLAPQSVEAVVSSLLRHGDPWRRAAAAHAAQAVQEHDRTAGCRLIPALLDGLRFSDELWSPNSSTREIATASGLAARHSITEFDSAVEARWPHATPSYRARMLQCYEAVARSEDELLPHDVARIILRKAIAALSEPLEVAPDGLEDDYAQHASELLKSLVRVSPLEVVSIDALLGLLLEKIEQAVAIDESSAEDYMSALDLLRDQARAWSVVRAVTDAVVSQGSHDPETLCKTCIELYEGLDSQPRTQAEVVRIVGRVGSDSLDIAGYTLPFIYTAMLGENQSVRAAGMDAAAELVRRIPRESIPPLLGQAIAAGLRDQYLIVVSSAVKALCWVPPDIVSHHEVINTLLAIARSYAADRLQHQLVEDSIRTALRIARSDDGLLSVVMRESLETIRLLPASYGRETLRRFPLLQDEDSWTDVAILALRAEDDPRFESIDGHLERELLQELGQRDLSDSQTETLVLNEIAVCRGNLPRSLLAADVLSEAGRPDLSVQLVRARLEEIPDTIEKQYVRSQLEIVLLQYECERAIAAEDRSTRSNILSRVQRLCDDEANDDSPSELVEALAEGRSFAEAINTMTARSRDARRAESIRALQARGNICEILDGVAVGQRAAEDLESALAVYDRDSADCSEGDVRWAFSEVVRALLFGVRWTKARLSAEPSAERYSTAARLRATSVVQRALSSWPDNLVAAARELADLADQESPARAAALLGRVALPLRGTEASRQPKAPRLDERKGREEQALPAVALLIRFGGEPVMRPTVLRPNAMHQLEVEARVDKWPSGAESLTVQFMTVLPVEFLYASALTFTPDALRQPLEIRVAGERPSGDPPLALTARANFVAESEELATRLAGNTTLELTTFDTHTATPLQLPTAARRLHDMMHELRNAQPNLPDTDRRDIRKLLDGILRFAHTVLDDRLGTEEDVDEAWFQRELRSFLQADPQIGARLEEKVGRAGGETDLLLGRIVLELKVEKNSAISLDEASRRFASQPVQYASAGDAPVSILTVLDVSEKRAPAGVMGNEIGWTYPEVASGSNPQVPSMVGVVVVRSGFPRPSDFSR